MKRKSRVYNILPVLALLLLVALDFSPAIFSRENYIPAQLVMELPPWYSVLDSPWLKCRLTLLMLWSRYVCWLNTSRTGP